MRSKQMAELGGELAWDTTMPVVVAGAGAAVVGA